MTGEPTAADVADQRVQNAVRGAIRALKELAGYSRDEYPRIEAGEMFRNGMIGNLGYVETAIREVRLAVAASLPPQNRRLADNALPNDR